MKHTPTPWATDFWGTNKHKTIKIGPKQEYGGSPIIKAVAIIQIDGETYTNENAENAAFIVRAVNAYVLIVKAWDDKKNTCAEDLGSAVAEILSKAEDNL